MTETHTIEKAPAVSSTTMHSLRTKYPPKRLVFSQDVLRRRVFMLLEIFNIFSTLKQFLEGHYMGRVGYISWTGLVKITEITKFLILVWASFLVSFFPGVSVCTYTTAATISEILLYIGPLNKTDIAYAKSISPINTVQKFTLKFWFYHHYQNKNHKVKYSFDAMDYTTVQIHTKLSSFLVPQMPKIFRSDGVYV